MRQLVLYNLKGEKLSLGGTPCVDSWKLIKSQLSPLKTIKDLRRCHMGEMKLPRIMFLCKPSAKIPSGAGAGKQFSYKDNLSTMWFCSIIYSFELLKSLYEN